MTTETITNTAPATFPDGAEVISTGTTSHGKWVYRTVTLFRAGRDKTGAPVWLKAGVLGEATTQAKIERMAAAEAAERGIPVLPRLRHQDAR